MKKLAEKVALVAQICITFVFVLVSILYMAGTITPQASWRENAVVFILVCILAVIYLVLSAYMIYMHFSERIALKNILLYSDSESATHATSKVIKKIATDNSKLVEGVRVRKVQIRPDEKMGFKMRVAVEIKGDNAAFAVDKLRCLLSDSFKSVLGLKFSTIDFRIKKMTTAYVPDVDKAEKQASILNAERTYTKDCYDQPIIDMRSASPVEVVETDATTENLEENGQNLNKKEENAQNLQENSVEEQGEIQEAVAEPVDDETASAILGKSNQQDETQRRMYGTPEDSPLSDDIVVEINDDDPSVRESNAETSEKTENASATEKIATEELQTSPRKNKKKK